MRSIIQLAGRILRHRRKKDNDEANVLLLNKNIKTLKYERANKHAICFEKPGFESGDVVMSEYDLNNILEKSQYEKINAIQRIELPKKNTQIVDGKYSNLVELEHQALRVCFFNKERGAKPWWKNKPHWCGEMQRQQRFRKSEKDEAYYLFLDDENSEIDWQYKNEDVFPPEFGNLCGVTIDNKIPIEVKGGNYFWFKQSPHEIYKQLSEDFTIELAEVSRRFGELRVVKYKNNDIEKYSYHENLGLYQDLGE